MPVPGRRPSELLTVDAGSAPTGSGEDHRLQEPRQPDAARTRGDAMWLVIALIVLAIIFGGVGLFVAAAKWALIIALILLVVGAIMGFMNRRRV
jgi:hypothetical protein